MGNLRWKDVKSFVWLCIIVALSQIVPSVFLENMTPVIAVLLGNMILVIAFFLEASADKDTELACIVKYKMKWQAYRAISVLYFIYCGTLGFLEGLSALMIVEACYKATRHFRNLEKDEIMMHVLKSQVLELKSHNDAENADPNVFRKKNEILVFGSSSYSDSSEIEEWFSSKDLRIRFIDCFRERYKMRLALGYIPKLIPVIKVGNNEAVSGFPEELFEKQLKEGLLDKYKIN